MMIKLFEQWLNENSSEKVSTSLARYFEDTWTEIKFPWEEEIEEKLEEIKDCITSLDTDFEHDRYTRGTSGTTFNFNIKVYDWPDVSGLATKYDTTEEEIDEAWHRYLEEQLTDFVDSLEYGWLDETWQSGRSGGWLTLAVNSRYDTETIKEDVINHLQEYVDSVEDYDPITKEDLGKMRGSLMGNKFGLGGNEKSNLVEEIQKEKTGTINLLNQELDTLKELKEGLEEVEKLIESGLEGLATGFPEWLEEEL